MPGRDGPAIVLIWAVAGINESLRALLSVVSFNAVLIALTVGTFWVGVVVARFFGRSASFSLSPLGFVRPRRGTLVGIGVGVAVGIAAVFVGGVANLLTSTVLERLGYSVDPNPQQPLMNSLSNWIGETPSLAIPLTVFVLVLFGPFVEELVFRGAIFNGMYRLGRLFSKRLGDSKEPRRFADVASFTLAAVVSSAVFALLHLAPILLPGLILLAIGLCALFRWSGSLLPSFVAHATFNSFATLVIILSGLGLFEMPPV